MWRFELVGLEVAKGAEAAFVVVEVVMMSAGATSLLTLGRHRWRFRRSFCIELQKASMGV